MGVIGKFMDSIRLRDNEDDDYFLDDEYDEDKPAKKGLFGGKKDDDYYDDIEEEEPPKPRFLNSVSRSSKVVPMKQRNMEVSMVKPTSIEDCKFLSEKSILAKALFALDIDAYSINCWKDLSSVSLIRRV